MQAAEIAQSFHCDGYAIVRSVFSAHELTETERELERILCEVVPRLSAGDVYFEDAPGKPIKHLLRLHDHAEFFRRLMEDQRLRSILGAVWPGAEVVGEGVSYFGKAAKSGSIAPIHQDNAFEFLYPPEKLVCTIAIDESTSANGALTVQKGSHRLGRLPHRASRVMGFSQTLVTALDADEYPEVQICMNPGDISLHHANTVHFSGPNTTDRSRRQLGIHFRTTRARREEAPWAKYQQELQDLHAQLAPVM